MSELKLAAGITLEQPEKAMREEVKVNKSGGSCQEIQGEIHWGQQR